MGIVYYVIVPDDSMFTKLKQAAVGYTENVLWF
jgi:hypothetical protein